MQVALFRASAAFRIVSIAVTALLVADPLLEAALAQEAQSEQTQEFSKEKLEQLVAPIALYPQFPAFSGVHGLDLSFGGCTGRALGEGKSKSKGQGP